MRRSGPNFRRGPGWGAFLLGLVALHAAFAATPYLPYLLNTLLRPPLELAAVLALAVFAPGGWRRPLRWTVLAYLALLVPLKLLDLGFFLAFDRPFDLALDAYLLPDGWTLLKGAVGPLRAFAAVAGIAALLAAILVGLYWALRSLDATRSGPRERQAGAALAAVLAVLSLVPMSNKVGLPGAPSLVLVAEHVKTSVRNIQDVKGFREALARDPYADLPADRLFGALRGKDVVLVFVESYGRGALQEARYAPVIQPRLTAVEQEIAKAGFEARSGWMRSPTHGGQSWLAHETLLSGLWIDGAARYALLTRSRRATLVGDFRRAGWRAVGIMPAIAEDWSEGGFLGFDRIYGAHDLGYRGPPFGWVTMPDQFTLLALHRAELERKDRPPVMAEVSLISSHAPFTPVPKLVDWAAVGDGAGFAPMTRGQISPEALWRDMDRVAVNYVATIDYSLASLAAYVRDFGDDRLVLIALGDHQPGGGLGREGGHETPVHLFSKDPQVLAAASRWGWAAGMRPDPKAPATPMDQFRGRLIESFTPAGR